MTSLATSSAERLRAGLPWASLARTIAMPGVYLAYWQVGAAAELQALGRSAEVPELASSSPASALAAMTLGWIAVLPATVQMVRTARRVELAERALYGAAEPVTALISMIALVEAISLAVALVTGVTVAIPGSILVAGLVEVALLQPRLERLAVAQVPGGGSVLVDARADTSHAGPGRLAAERFARALEARWVLAVGNAWNRAPRLVRRAFGAAAQFAAQIAAAAAISVALAILYLLGRLLAAEDRTGLLSGCVTALLLSGAWVIANATVGLSLRRATRLPGAIECLGRLSRDRRFAFVACLGLAGSLVWLWSSRALYHGLVMAIYQWPLATWIPFVFGLSFVAACVLVAILARRGARAGFAAGVSWRGAVTLGAWAVALAILPGLQGSALYDATAYLPGGLPLSTQPRLLPKAGAESFADSSDLHNAHLVVDPTTGELVWSAESASGLLRRGGSSAVVEQPLGRVDGTETTTSAGFRTAVSQVGPGSLQWRAYGRHFFTRVEDAVLVPVAGGGAEAIAPYVAYRGFPVRHPYWAGVYVYHQDGRIEDLTPRQALARPELVASGRLFPERLAREIASAYGYRDGAAAVLSDPSRTVVTDPQGNPQPYLTKVGPGSVWWVTVAHPASDESTVSAIFMTSSSTGATHVWKPRPGQRLLSNAGAVSLVQNLPLDWTGCCDDNGDVYWLRKVVEPTPVFSHARLYYIVSVIPNPQYLSTAEPVDETVIVDAQTRRIARQYDHSDPSADAQIRAFLGSG